MAHESVDFIYSCDVLKHVDDVAVVFATAYWLLKPGGVFVISIGIQS